MTVFCPNCGKPNLDSATQCVACTTELKPKSEAKFKGTMMMSGVQVPDGPPPPGGLPPGPPGGGFGAAPPAPPPPGGGFGAAPPPPGGGFGAAPPPPGGGFGAAPPAGPPPGGGFGAAPPAGPPPGGGFGAAPPGGGFGAAPPGGGFGAAPPGGGFAPPGGGFGAAPPAGPPPGGGFGGAPPAGPPPGGGFGPPGGGFGGAPPGGPPPGGGFGAAPGGAPDGKNIAFQKTMAMSSPMDEGQTPAAGGFGAPGSSPGGFGHPGGPPGGFGAPASPAPMGFGAPPAQPQQGFGGPTMMAAPEKKKKSPLMFVAIGCLALLALSCIGGNVYWFLFARSGSSADAVVEGATNEGSGSTEGSGGGTVCSRAAECCEAYVNEMAAAGTPGLDVEQTCGAIRMAGVPDVTCQTTIDGYRTSLQAMGRTVPTSCQ